MTHFDVGKFGPTDWEGLASDPASGTLLVGARKTKQIFEVTKTGSLVRTIDASGISGMKFLSGLATAPASNGTGQMNYWIVDRAVDNGSNSNENDGRIFEITVAGSSGASISGFSPPSGPVGTSVTINGSGFTGATGVSFNGTSVGAGNFTVVSDAKITATVPQGATTGQISVTTPGGTGTSSTAFTVSPSPQPTISGFSPPSGPVGQSVTINGSGFTGTTDVMFNGTSVGSGNFTVNSDIQITATVPQGAITGQISVTTPGGTATSSTDFTVTLLTTLTFGPDADTFVRADNPTAHPGTKTSLTVDNAPIKHGLLRFTVSGVGSGTIQSVKLRLFCLDTADNGGDFYRVSDNSWPEKTVNWNSQPAADLTSLASLGAVTANTWYEVDLSSLVTGDGTYSIRIASTSSNGADYSTKEGAAGFGPQLVVAFGQ